MNLVGIILAATDHFPYAKRHSAAITLGNILATCAVRNEFFLRCVFWILVKLFQKVSQSSLLSFFSTKYVLKWTPLWWRVTLTAFLQHLGGIHSGCAVAGFAWIVYTVYLLFQNHVALHVRNVTLAWGVITSVVLFVVAFAAMPWIRERHHKYATHCFLHTERC